MKRTVLTCVALLALLSSLWLFGNNYVLHIATMVVIMAPMALSLNIMMKLGQLSIAQPAFMGIGAYGAALLTMRLGVPPLLSMLAGATIAAAMAAISGPVFLRIKGVYFVLLTYAFSQVVNLVFQEWVSLFGGNSGLYGIPKFSPRSTWNDTSDTAVRPPKRRVSPWTSSTCPLEFAGAFMHALPSSAIGTRTPGPA